MEVHKEMVVEDVIEEIYVESEEKDENKIILTVTNETVNKINK